MPTIVEAVSTSGSFKTLVAAVRAAGLVEHLSGEGPFTVFAPTDDAFEKLPTGTIAELLMPEAKDKLVSILNYHVLAGYVPADEVAGLSSAKTVSGKMLTFDIEHGVWVNEAMVVAADIECGNGLIHVIDCVLIPE